MFQFLDYWIARIMWQNLPLVIQAHATAETSQRPFSVTVSWMDFCSENRFGGSMLKGSMHCSHTDPRKNSYSRGMPYNNGWLGPRHWIGVTIMHKTIRLSEGYIYSTRFLTSTSRGMQRQVTLTERQLISQAQFTTLGLITTKTSNLHTTPGANHHHFYIAMGQSQTYDYWQPQ